MVEQGFGAPARSVEDEEVASFPKLRLSFLTCYSLNAARTNFKFEIARLGARTVAIVAVLFYPETPILRELVAGAGIIARSIYSIGSCSLLRVHSGAARGRRCSRMLRPN